MYPPPSNFPPFINFFKCAGAPVYFEPPFISNLRVLFIFVKLCLKRNNKHKQRKKKH